MNLRILYTANLGGNIEQFPRLHSFIRYLKALPLDEGDEVMLCAVQPVQARWLMLDLGNACAPDVWHCGATDGRSMLIALDAMGYNAANVANALTDESRERLKANLLDMHLVNVGTPWLDDTIGVYANLPPTVTASALNIILTPAQKTFLDGSRLHLANVRGDQIGAVVISMDGNIPNLLTHTIYDLPSTTQPDATISAAVDFILSEARLFKKK